jgi:hypothetical protein
LQLTHECGEFLIPFEVRERIMDQICRMILQRRVIPSELFEDMTCVLLNQFCPLIQIDGIRRGENTR